MCVRSPLDACVFEHSGRMSLPISYWRLLMAKDDLTAHDRLSNLFITQNKSTNYIPLLEHNIEHRDYHNTYRDSNPTIYMKLWGDKAVQEVYEEKRLECHLHESTRFFLDSVDRISNVNYKPTDQDILLTRIKTTGIVEVAFVIKKVQF
ncbi:unnamed protein product, partial [Strongylus vulgaris]